jgi:hypothetical protein
VSGTSVAGHARRQGETRTVRRYALVLGILTLLFVGRVVGQPLALLETGLLPPFERWSSGLVPYPLLLPLQLALIVLMLWIVRDFATGRGFFVALAPRTGVILMRLSYLYASVMVARYIVTMTMHPELRYFTGTIPIWFHFVLAAFLYTLGRWQVRHGAAADDGRIP